MPTILGVSGSLKSTSRNSGLIRASARLVPDEVTFSFYNELASLPHFSPDLDEGVGPEPVQRWREALRAADGVLICTPEYAYGIPGSLKNALDWTVSSGEFYGKPVAALSAAPNAGGGARAHTALLLTLTALTAIVPDDAQLSVPLINTKLNANDQIENEALVQSLKAMISALVRVAAEKKPTI